MPQRSFGEFKARQKAVSAAAPEDRALIKAFQQGEDAGRADRGRAACPYAPFSEADRWAAWQLGYGEQCECWVIAAPSRLAPAARPSA